MRVQRTAHTGVRPHTATLHTDQRVPSSKHLQMRPHTLTLRLSPRRCRCGRAVRTCVSTEIEIVDPSLPLLCGWTRPCPQPCRPSPHARRQSRRKHRSSQNGISSPIERRRSHVNAVPPPRSCERSARMALGRRICRRAAPTTSRRPRTCTASVPGRGGECSCRYASYFGMVSIGCMPAILV